MKSSDWIAFAAVVISLIALFRDALKDWLSSKVLKETNKIDLGWSILPAKYIGERDYNPISGDIDEIYQLEIPYQIQNKGNNPVIVDRVLFVFQNPVDGKHIKTLTQDFSNGLIVIKDKDSKDLTLRITFSDSQKVNEIYGLSISLRIELRGYNAHFTFNPILLEFQSPD